MKKKETLWQLLKRLDEEAARFNIHLHKANHYFDGAAHQTQKVLEKHEKDLHKLIKKLRDPLHKMMRKMKKRKPHR